MRLGGAASMARLARWLGPWADEQARPEHVERRTVSIAPERPGDRPMQAWVFSPTRRRPIGSLLLVPGLHFRGPSDPRMERFTRIVADAGVVVLAPFLPDFLELRVEPGLLRDTERALAALEALPHRPAGRPGMFSISFGSLPALRVASDEAHAHRLGGLVVFGGYADWNETIRFSLHGAPDRPHDPLNRPVVFLNLLEHLPGAPEDPTPLADAWRRYVRATWNQPEMKERRRHEPVARALAEELPETMRELFLVGCGVAPGGWELCQQALARASDRAWLDPRPHLGGLRCPTWIVHGRDDDVIPYTEAGALLDAMPPSVRAREHVTGLYAHTGQSRVRELLGALPTLARELGAMAGILRAIVAASTDRAR